LNRFYGVFQDGKVKVRGIELRRGDTPNIVRQCQDRVMRELAKARNSEEFIRRIPEALSILREYANRIINHEVDLYDLVISKQISKDPDQYVNNVHQAIAAQLLQEHGLEVNAGQTVKYIIIDADNRYPKRRVLPVPLINTRSHYDVGEYLKLLVDAFYTILSPFNYPKEKLTAWIHGQVDEHL
jgi:DNA polymerase-2